MSETSWRYENKIVLKGLSSEKALNQIILSPAFFRPAFPGRIVNNLYFDTANLNCFYDHTASLGSRFKARLRWYDGQDRTQLEIKYRSGDVGTKYVYPITEKIEFWSAFNLEKIFRKMTIPESFREQLLCLGPILFNRYCRDYYVSLQPGIRLTLDRQIHYRSFFSNTWLNEAENLKILELKYNVEEAKRGQMILNHFSQAREKSSKYVRGILRTQDI